MHGLVFMRSSSAFARCISAVAVLASGLLLVACGGGGSGSNEEQPPPSSASGTLYWADGLSASTLDVASGQERNVASLSFDTQAQLGYGGGMFTEVEVTGLLPSQVKINLREVAPNPYALRSSLGPFPLSGFVLGPVRPSPDGKLFTMNTTEGEPKSNFVYVFDASLDIVFKIKDYYHPVWLGNDRVVVARGASLYTLTMAASPIVTRIGVDGLGLPGQGIAVPSVSPDGRSIAFVQGEAVWRINVDGTELAQLTKPSSGINWPSWSPDGSRLVTTNRCTSSQNNFVIVSATATNQDRDAIRPTTYACGPVYWLP